jgi:SAM-dependent methyltransferase/uncharacterized tellurite resistance protein B-like protein
VPSRIEKEKDFHNVAFSKQVRESTGRFYAIAENTARAYKDRIAELGAGKRVLEYGCGAHSNAIRLAKLGARMTAIDISDVAIEESRKVARREGVDGVDFRVMNAEDLAFDSSTFDLVCGSAILHHLVLVRAYAQLARVLKPDGVAVFLEPLGHNPAINLYRAVTPSLRTEDEHPLLRSDIELTRVFFDHVDVTYHHLVTLAGIPLVGTPVFPKVLGALEGVDRLLFSKVPTLRGYAWSCMMVLRGPNKGLSDVVGPRASDPTEEARRMLMLRILVDLVWTDHHLDDGERAMVCAAAARLGMTAERGAELERLLSRPPKEGDVRLHLQDLAHAALTRAERARLRALLGHLAAADGEVADVERALIRHAERSLRHDLLGSLRETLRLR